MEELPSTEKCQDHQTNTANELMTVRLLKMEELIKDLSSRVQNADATIASVSTCVTELSNQFTQTRAKSSPESGHGNFPQSYLRGMMTSLSMPGMKFIGEEGRSWLHSCLWIFIHIVALLISYVLIKEEYDNWKDSPVVVATSNNITYVNEIPFPAITVCLPGSVKEGYDYAGAIDKCLPCKIPSLYNRYCAFNEDCTYEERASLAIASLGCPYHTRSGWSPLSVFTTYVKHTMGGPEFTNYSKNVFPQCGISVNLQTMLHREIDYYPVSRQACGGKDYLKFVSNIGSCFTINGLRYNDIFKENTVISSEEMSLGDESSDEKNYYKGKDFKLENMIYFNGDVDTIPAYTSDAHEHIFVFVQSSKKEGATLCQEPEPNHNKAYLTIHNPVEVPFIFERDFGLQPHEEKEIRVTPRMLITEKGLEGYTPTERGCFYSYERELAMFKHYSEKKCKTECAANCSLQHCGCVPYYLPRHNSSVEVCLRECYEASLCERACSCLPDCYSLTYDFETVKEIDKGKNSFEREASLHMKYKTRYFHPTVRVGLTNLAQFMAYCLGIVGVFNGFSFIIIFEILYFFTFKLWISVK